MIYYKISFFIVLISIVCFSSAVKTLEGALRDKEDCKKAMKDTFVDITTSTTKCIQHGIQFMKLYGTNAISYDKHVKMYYTLFYKSVQIDSVILPDKYCTMWGPQCKEELQIFLKPPTFLVITDDEEHIEEGISRSNRGISQNNPSSSQDYFVIVDSSISHINPGSSQNDFGIIKHNVDGSQNYFIDDVPKDRKAAKRRADGILRSIVLKNALYLHVIVDQSKEIQLPNNDEAKKYFHEAGCSFTYPSDFCNTIYQKVLKDIDEENIRRNYGLS